MKSIFKKLSKNQTFIAILGCLIIFGSIGISAFAIGFDGEDNTSPDLEKYITVTGNDIGNLNVYLNPQSKAKESSLEGMSFGSALHNNINTIFEQGLRAGINETQVINSDAEVVAVINTTTINASGAVALASTLDVLGETDVEGLTDGSGANQLATSTGTTNISQADLLADSFLEIMVNTGATASLQLSASSTWTTLLQGESKHRAWIIHNATSSTMALTILAGTGIDFVGVTTDDDVIDQTEYSKMDCWRKPNTDIVCSLTEWLHLD